MKRIIFILFIILIPSFSIYTMGFREYNSNELLAFIPENYTNMIFYLNIRNLAETVLFDEFFDEDNNFIYEKLLKNDINIKEDVYSMLVAGNGKMDNFTEAIAVINMSYDKNTIIDNLDDDVMEEEYNGKTLYSWVTEDNKNQSIYFANNSIIIIGTDYVVKESVDIRDQSINNNIDITINDRTFLWGKVLITSEIKDMLNLNKNNDFIALSFSRMAEMINSVEFYADYNLSDYYFFLNLINDNESINQEFASIFNTIKAILLFADDMDEESKELLNNIHFLGNSAGVIISITLTEELLFRAIEKNKENYLMQDNQIETTKGI